MKQYEREYFVSRVIAGYMRYPVNKYLTLLIHTPTHDQMYEANEVYLNSYKQSAVEGAMDDEEVFELMLQKNLWSDEQQEMLDQLPKDVEEWKVQIFENFVDSEQKEMIRKYLRRAEEVFGKVHSERHAFDHMTCNGVAANSKWNWIIENCTTDTQRNPYTWKDIGISSALSYYQRNLLDDGEIRSLARNEPWKTHWIVNKGQDSLFLNSDKELTSEQRGIFIWSKMYDSISESIEAPSENIINDDDALDGWLITQRRKRDTEKNEKEVQGKIANDKIANSSEVFVMAKTKEDASKVDDVNTFTAKKIKDSRTNYIHTKGSEVKQGEFKDVKMSINQQSNSQFKDTIRRI